MAGRKRGAPENDELEEFNRERQAAVASRIQALDERGAKRTLDEICARWKLDDRTMSSFQDALELALTNFGLDPHKDVEASDVGNRNLREIDGCVHSHEMELIGLYYRLRDFKLLEDPETLRRVTTCLEQVYYAKRAVLNVFQSKLSVYQLQATDAINPYELDEDLDKRLGSWSLRFRWIDDDTVPVQKLLLHMLDRAMEKRYRRQGDWCYEPVVVDGHDTHAWQPVMKIEQWLYSECQKETNWEQWQWLTMAKSTVSHVMEYLTKCQDYSFPELRKDRSTFAFSNGVYRAREDKFYPHEGSTLSHTIAACKYFPIEFPSYQRAEDIPTPNLDSIMEYQEWEPAVRTWLYILLGRLLYDLNDLDGWQVIPFFCGQAGSGKSSVVLKVAKVFYEDIDVGNLSNNIETKFGLSQFYDKLLFVAPEIKGDLKIEQAEFQSIVSGEDITINEKHKTAFSVTWKTPGVLAGNEVPNWCDNAGSIQRRIILFDFPKQVVNGDMQLADKLEAEIAHILLKCNKMYLEAVRKWSSANVWTVLPTYFKRTRDAIAASTNVVEAFLSSSDVMLKPGHEIYMEDFKTALKTFAKQNNFAVKRFTGEFFRGPFQKFGVKMERRFEEVDGKTRAVDYLSGVELVTVMGPNAMG